MGWIQDLHFCKHPRSPWHTWSRSHLEKQWRNKEIGVWWWEIRSADIWMASQPLCSLRLFQVSISSYKSSKFWYFFSSTHAWMVILWRWKRVGIRYIYIYSSPFLEVGGQVLIWSVLWASVKCDPSIPKSWARLLCLSPWECWFKTCWFLLWRTWPYALGLL